MLEGDTSIFRNVIKHRSHTGTRFDGAALRGCQRELPFEEPAEQSIGTSGLPCRLVGERYPHAKMMRAFRS
jgi:hypothetical protein